MARETRESSFDELARGLASGDVSRGKALRLIGAALVGGTLASIPGVAFARAPRTPPTGKGGCIAGRTNCRGKCYDLQSDRNNCGQCGNVCSDVQECQGGTCMGAPPPPVQCDNALNNCATDDCVCGAGTACAANGDCVLPVQCDNTLNDCSTDPCVCGTGTTCDSSGQCIVN